MTRRYLFGPVNARFADQCLYPQRQRGECIAFNLHDGSDLTIGFSDSWAEVCSRLPASWQPDFIVLYLPYRAIPPCLWSAPIPVVGLAADWNLLWHYYRRCLPACDLVLTDSVGVACMQSAGMQHGRAANIYGCERFYTEPLLAEPPRDIDVLFVGSFHSAIHRERLSWLGRIAQLSERWKVVLCTGAYFDDHRALLAARIVFNRSIAGSCNARAIEATAAGALLFQEAGNPEVEAHFEDRREYIAYRENDLESLLEYYLEHEEARRTIAEAGQHRARDYSFAALWDNALERITVQLREVSQTIVGNAALLQRSWQQVNCTPGTDPQLAFDLQQALATEPRSAELHHALAVALALVAQKDSQSDHAAIVSQLQLTLDRDPTHVIASLNLTEMLLQIGQNKLAMEQAQRALAILDRSAHLNPEVLNAPYLPPAFDYFRVEWERAGWRHTGEPTAEERAKRLLLRWRLHSVLATLTGDLSHYYEAAVARPDLPCTRAALGCALAREGRFTDALPHLAQALTDNPFDAAAAHACFNVLGEFADHKAQDRLIRERRLLAQAAPGIVQTEQWFQESRVAGQDLASIVILCCNQLEYTRQCLDSVLQHTRSPYELLIIDNGSTDSTPAYLEDFQRRPGPNRVEVIRNDTNRGFAAGCNQGLAASRGRFLVLLNNDTIVTPGWLDGLIRWSLHDWPKVGIVGPMTSCSSPPQEIPINYRTPDELLAFAARRRKAFEGQAAPVQRLIGFCMLVRRDVWEKLGGLDENFGIGFFEDDDLCVRVREAGFTLLMALDVFIHHYGNRTFRGLGIDAYAQLQTNFEKFRAKWGDERCVGYRMPDAPDGRPKANQKHSTIGRSRFRELTSDSGDQLPAMQILNSQRPTVSLCMIVKNEERHLAACLTSVADLVDEIIVVDTGSTDRTKEIAQQLGARVYDFAWVDSFAAARNESLRPATGEWIFWLDADEELDATNRQRLRSLFISLKDENVAYVMRQFSKLEKNTHAAAQVDQVRLFRNRASIRWQYRVHEQILLSVRRSGGDVRLTDIVIDHAGFSDPQVQGPKVDRNLRLLELELAENPDDTFVLYNLGAVRLTQGQNAEALNLFRRSLSQSQPGDVLIRKLHALITRAFHQLGQKTNALMACREGLAAFPDDGELLFWKAMLLREQNDLDGAVTCLRQVLKARPSQHFTSVDAGLYSYRARHFLAETYRDQDRHSDAEAEWRTVVKECPEFTPAWLELAKMFVQDKRWIELAEVLPHLERDPQMEIDAKVLKGRVYLAEKEFAAAKDHFQEAIERAPNAVLPRVLMSHSLLQEGVEWAKAQEALLDVLQIDPGHKEAQHNLHVLRQQHPELAYDKVFSDGEAVQFGDAEETSGITPLALDLCIQPKVSLCMIVRNEEQNLSECLATIADLVDEMIVVDTGSTDRTKEIALKLGAKVFDFPWIDHFAAARNESLRHATGRWIFWLDADDRLNEENRAKLRALCAGLKNEIAGYVMKCVCLPDSQGVETAVDHLRLFRNHPQARWTFRVHEQILPSLRSLKADVQWSDVVIHHTGYQDSMLRQRKLQRDLRLLQLEQADQPDHAFTLFNLGSVYQELGRTAEALQMFRRSLDRSAPEDSIVRKLYALIAQCYRALGQKTEALAACQIGLESFPEDIELLFQQGVSLRDLGDIDGAIGSWEQCLQTPPGAHFASVNTGLRGHITRHNLAIAYKERGQESKAEEAWAAALLDRPAYEPAWRGLTNLLLGRQRWWDVEELARRIEDSELGGTSAVYVRGRLHLARKEFPAARRLLEGAIALSPRAVEPRVLLSHALLQEGRDWSHAERSLRDILVLDPDHTEAKHNLAVLLEQHATP